MTENKRYIVAGSDDFFQHIEDTTLTEDKHEGTIDNIYQVVRRLNEQDERIKELETVVQDILYEARFTVGKGGEVCVFVSPQAYKRLTELLKEKIKW